LGTLSNITDEGGAVTVTTTSAAAEAEPMTHPQISDSAPHAGRLASFPALAELGLGDADLAALAHQGFLALERRQERTYYKLRFRRDGRQIVRYVGGVEKMALVAEELSLLQTARRHQRELNELVAAARKQLRNGKAQLEPALLERGFKFHGLAIRRQRRPA
jgi:hypothetical protein